MIGMLTTHRLEILVMGQIVDIDARAMDYDGLNIECLICGHHLYPPDDPAVHIGWTRGVLEECEEMTQMAHWRCVRDVTLRVVMVAEERKRHQRGDLDPSDREHEAALTAICKRWFLPS